MIPVSEALSRLFELVRPMPVETVPLAEAVGRVLAEDAVAKRTQPPFAASAMDGYAVRAEEAAIGQSLDVIGESAAGHRFRGLLGPGQAVRIFTGAPVPEGADAILIQEDSDRAGPKIIVRQRPDPGAYVRPAGGDFTAGDRLAAPRRLTSRDIALLAAMNIPEVPVRRRPEVALIPTGDELVDPGGTPGPDQIITSNNHGLAARLDEAGALPRLCPIARDNPDSLTRALEAAAGCNIIVTLGGASVGDHDLVAEVFASQGLELDFYKIAMRPGKPLMAGRLGDAAMIGLPGNPVSALVCGEVFLLPAIDVALGLPAAARQTRRAPLSHDLDANGPREHYMRAFLEPDGRLNVFENQDSSLLATLARATCLAVRRPFAEPLPAGTFVEYIPLD